MNNELEIWRFAAERLERGENVMLLVVAESSGSSPGRVGYKMAVGSDGELVGSIGGGIMEVNLVDNSRRLLSESPAANDTGSFLVPQVHQKDKANSSGMICSGRQTVIFKILGAEELQNVKLAVDSLLNDGRRVLRIGVDRFEVGSSDGRPQKADLVFEKVTDTDFNFEELLGYKNDLYIIGGGHCALALSELMSKLDFYVRIYDDRPELNTVEKNRFAQEKHIVDSYDTIGQHIEANERGFVVVMTLGYKSDEIAIKQLINKDFAYFGVLGSEAKMKVVFAHLEAAGIPKERFSRLYTPIGLPINSHTPEEIAISIAAEIISVRNSATKDQKKNLLVAKKNVDNT